MDENEVMDKEIINAMFENGVSSLGSLFFALMYF